MSNDNIPTTDLDTIKARYITVIDNKLNELLQEREKERKVWSTIRSTLKVEGKTPEEIKEAKSKTNLENLNKQIKNLRIKRQRKLQPESTNKANVKPHKKTKS